MDSFRIPQPTKTLTLLAILSVTGCSIPMHAQSMQPMQSSGRGGTLPQSSAANLQPMLAQIDQSAQQAALELAKLRIEKWKADNNSQQQAPAVVPKKIISDEDTPPPTTSKKKTAKKKTTTPPSQ